MQSKLERISERVLIMNKVAYNRSYGGFGLSQEAVEYLIFFGVVPNLVYFEEETGWPNENYYEHVKEIPRHNPYLVFVVESLGKKADGSTAKLSVKEIDSKHYYIDNYDGKETVIQPTDIDWVAIPSKTKYMDTDRFELPKKVFR